MTRAICYARYSTDQQNPLSIADQLANVRVLAKRIGAEIVEEYSDAATSGKLFTERPGIQQLIQRLRGGDVGFVLADALDRLSRDQEHLARIYKLACFWNVAIVTVGEGEINEMHVGMGSTMSASLLKAISRKTRTGLRGTAERGGFTGGPVPFGYRLVWEGKKGKKSHLVIDDEQARVIRHIFELFVAGNSPRRISQILNEENIVPPKGKGWSPSAIGRSTHRASGFLNNPLYAGDVVFGRTEWRTNPEDDKRKVIHKPRDQWVVRHAPELAIVSPVLWKAVQARRAEIAGSKTSEAKRRAATGRYPKSLLSGLLKCPECGSGYIVVAGRRGPRKKGQKVDKNPDRTRLEGSYGCGTHSGRGNRACTNNRRIPWAAAERLILDGIAVDLPTSFDEVENVIRERLLARNLDRSGEQRKAKAALTKVETRLARIVTAIGDGMYSPALKDEAEKLERQKAGIEAELRIETVDFAEVAATLPIAVDEFRAMLKALDGGELTHDGVTVRRALMDLCGGEIRVLPQPDGSTQFLVQGDYGAMLELVSNRQKRARQRCKTERTRTGTAPSAEVAAMLHARTCYDHLAGRLGVALADALTRQGHLLLGEDGGEVTDTGLRLLREFGLELPPASRSRRVFCRPCIDWTERRPHLAGALGAAIAARCFDLGWGTRMRDTRALAVSTPGREGLLRVFGLDLDGAREACAAQAPGLLRTRSTAARQPA